MKFNEFVVPILDLPISHAWRGHGATIFLELGHLSPGKKRRDGSDSNARGEFTLFIDPGWRFEGKRSILCGSGDSVGSIERMITSTIGTSIAKIATSGRLPELEVFFSDDRRLLTFSTFKGQPGWTIHRWSPQVAAYSQFGSVKFDGDAPNKSFKPNLLRSTSNMAG